MKTSATQNTPPPPAFVPVTLSITFESKDEMIAFASLFNQLSVNDVMHRVGGMRSDVAAWTAFGAPLTAYGVDPSGPMHDRMKEFLFKWCQQRDPSR